MTTSVAEAGQRLLQDDQPFDVAVLDGIVAAAYEPRHPERATANEILMKLREKPGCWQAADQIIEKSSLPQGRYFGLMALDDAINTRWKILPEGQRTGIKNFIVNKIISLSKDEESSMRERTMIHQMNKARSRRPVVWRRLHAIDATRVHLTMKWVVSFSSLGPFGPRRSAQVLVSILKQEWPHNWPSFIGDICGASKNSEILCENNMHILRLLSEEVFDFSKDSMTTAKIRTLKESLNTEFAEIFKLCIFVLGASSRPQLISATLRTLKAFLSWIPLGYLFETDLIRTLIERFFAAAQFRNAALECLTEIASLADLEPKYDAKVVQLYVGVLQALGQVVPPNASLASAFEATGREADQTFVRRLALFFSGFFKAHLRLVETREQGPLLLDGLNYLVRISAVPDNEVFQICLDFWHAFVYSVALRHRRASSPGMVEVGGFFVEFDPFRSPRRFAQDLYATETGRSAPRPGGYGNDDTFEPPVTSEGPGGVASRFGGRAPEGWPPADPRKQLFQHGGLLSQARLVMISRMAKPEEVLVVEDENGEIVRETFKDTEAIVQHKTMRETLVYLTHLNYDDTESIMLDKLALQVDGTEWSWANLNTLCWAVGSISGAMSEDEEKRFLVTVIKDLLGLCEVKRGKGNKACIASNIMYVVGQYPRFLRAHWKFLKTVVNKLFEFMHELHPGVQDMACDTFLKIAQKCKRKFVTQQPAEPRPFVQDLVAQLPQIISDLEPHQVHAFYEATATLLSDRGGHPSVGQQRPELLRRLMTLPNDAWARVTADAARDPSTLTRPETVRDVTKIVRTHARVCASCGPLYVTQLGGIYMDLLNVYRAYSRSISEAIAAHGDLATRHQDVRSMRAAKREILRLLSTFVEKCGEPEAPPRLVAESFVPPLLEPVLEDYAQAVPAARDSDALLLLATTIDKLRELVSEQVPRVLEAVFEPTLRMITTNFEDFPEHRLAFFKLLKATNTHCFAALFAIPPEHHKLVVDSVVWAFKHTERTVAETGLEILHELLLNVSQVPDAAKQPFYRAFVLPLIQDVLAVMTDRLHKSGFKMHATLLRHLFHLVEAGHVTVPLFDGGNYPTNQAFMREHVANLLKSSFPNLTHQQVVDFVVGCFDLRMDLPSFKTHLRDFLVQLKEFSAENNQDLYSEEQQQQQQQLAAAAEAQRLAVPGLVNPNDRPMDDDEDL